MRLNYDFRFQILRQYFVSAILAVRLHSWGKCADYGIPINFISPSGRFLARVQGASHGNVLLRKRQYELFSKPPALLRQNTVAAKLANTKVL